MSELWPRLRTVQLRKGRNQRDLLCQDLAALVTVGRVGAK